MDKGRIVLPFKTNVSPPSDNKWVTPKQLVDVTEDRHKVGDIVWSVRDLEKETQGKFALCDGRSYTKTGKPKLWEVLGPGPENIKVLSQGSSSESNYPISTSVMVGSTVFSVGDGHTLYAFGSGGRTIVTGLGSCYSPTCIPINSETCLFTWLQNSNPSNDSALYMGVLNQNTTSLTSQYFVTDFLVFADYYVENSTTIYALYRHKSQENRFALLKFTLNGSSVSVQTLVEVIGNSARPRVIFCPKDKCFYVYDSDTSGKKVNTQTNSSSSFTTTNRNIYSILSRFDVYEQGVHYKNKKLLADIRMNENNHNACLYDIDCENLSVRILELPLSSSYIVGAYGYFENDKVWITLSYQYSTSFGYYRTLVTESPQGYLAAPGGVPYRMSYDTTPTYIPVYGGKYSVNNSSVLVGSSYPSSSKAVWYRYQITDYIYLPDINKGLRKDTSIAYRLPYMRIE